MRETDAMLLSTWPLGAVLVPRAIRHEGSGARASEVEERYAGWLAQPAQAGAVFTEQQRWWLDRIADVIATSAGVTADELDNAPFTERGGIDGVVRDLGAEAATYLEQLNAELTA